MLLNCFGYQPSNNGKIAGSGAGFINTKTGSVQIPQASSGECNENISDESDKRSIRKQVTDMSSRIAYTEITPTLEVPNSLKKTASSAAKSLA